MRPLRFLLTIATSVIAFFALLFIGPWRASTQQQLEGSRGGGPFGTYFHWRTPSSLFPPSAVISLTDDNSTFFLARPAAFGPLLPAKSLSGQLWIGGGFGDDHLGRAGQLGELGCSDVPGWEGGSSRSMGVGGSKRPGQGGEMTTESESGTDGGKKRRRKRQQERGSDSPEVSNKTEFPDSDDGTDDHLHHPLPPSSGLKTNGESTGPSKKPVHADIQSLQESAEIAGKIVLLSRGGCGFLEKVKWAQRRGGVALIVGDDMRGAPLLTMYARGDTSNITIPSLFTSYTTAHLLSSLIPSGGIMDGLSPEDAERLGLALGEDSGPSRAGSQKAPAAAEKPNFTPTTTAIKTTKTEMAHTADKQEYQELLSNAESDGSEQLQNLGWLRRILFGKRARNEDRGSRPPSSGHVNWVQADFNDREDGAYVETSSSSAVVAPAQTPRRLGGDGFVIGVQDWRDPDLVAEQREQLLAFTSSSSSRASPSVRAQSTKRPVNGAFGGGSVTPSSGEYVKGDVASQSHHDEFESDSKPTDQRGGGEGGWFSRLFRPRKPTEAVAPASNLVGTATDADERHSLANLLQSKDELLMADDGPVMHEGLWITLSPTSISSSPFFDTLLVLVVSPLVTLTVVYALLLLRSRIRRRRWRAPKSVVERLPVRTYQTMPSTANTSSTSSSISSPITSTTPLLPASARSVNSRSRPRSRTLSELPIQPSSSIHSDGFVSPSPDQIEEKRAAGLAEWRKRYGGKQRECVVCLEEYVDGISRVMSLPCGHEFHAECITPWLTTKRRTCPICKGDVVRSLARSTSPTGRSPASLLNLTPLDHSHSEEGDMETPDQVQNQVASTRNDDPASNQPLSREDEAFEDLERGISSSDRERR